MFSFGSFTSPRDAVHKNVFCLLSVYDIVHFDQVSAEDVKERQDRLAKMRNLLFRHELKSKRIKNIKSKTYRRLLKKDQSKVGSIDTEMDPEVAKELAQKQEFKRAEVIIITKNHLFS